MQASGAMISSGRGIRLLSVPIEVFSHATAGRRCRRGSYRYAFVEARARAIAGRPCHHMAEILGDPTQVPGWTDAIEGRPVDWSALLAGYRSIVDWPGGAFWRELSAANPDALVLLSVRDPESWYRSASNTIFLAFDRMPAELMPWMNTMRKLLRDRFSDRFDDPAAMMERSNVTTPPCDKKSRLRGCWNGPPGMAGSRSANASAWQFLPSRFR